MNDTETTAIVASQRNLPIFSINEPLKLAKAAALEKSALIGKVTDADSKIIAVRAQVELKRLISQIEKARKEAKEPLLSAGRQLDNLCAAEALDLDKEFGRVSNVVNEFDLAERRRVQEEERIQREELARIEREKQAEIERLAKEQRDREEAARKAQEEIDRKAREAREAAAKAVRDADSAKERKAAQKLLEEAAKREADAATQRQQQEAALAAQRAQTESQTAAIEEKAGDAAYCAAKPIEITKVAGQRLSSNWVITVTQPFVLAKFHPDLVNISPRLGDIKAALNEGREIKGITAVREHVSGVRLPAERKAIEV